MVKCSWNQSKPKRIRLHPAQLTPELCLSFLVRKILTTLHSTPSWRQTNPQKLTNNAGTYLRIRPPTNGTQAKKVSAIIQNHLYGTGKSLEILQKYLHAQWKWGHLHIPPAAPGVLSPPQKQQEGYFRLRRRWESHSLLYGNPSMWGNFSLSLYKNKDKLLLEVAKW